jgi:transposase
MITPTCFVGCDVGKKEIALFHSNGGISLTIPNQPEALARFVGTLRSGCLVVCEATGGYEAALLEAVHSAGIACHRADARKVKAFIRSLGTLAKTDAIDARMLARYGQERHDRLARWKPLPAEQRKLHALVMARRDIVAACTAWNNRSKAPVAADIQPLLDPIVQSFRTQLKAIDTAIDTLVRQGQLAARARTLQAIAGIGAITAYSLLALMPELGTLSRKQAASLAGLAPHPRQSGAKDAYRRVRGGRPAVRNALFMAALAAARSNPQVSAFYKRLISNGKKPIVAITAVMRKLITIANAALKLS